MSENNDSTYREQIQLFENILQRVPADQFSLEELIRLYGLLGKNFEVEKYRYLLNELKGGRSAEVRVGNSHKEDSKVRSIRREVPVVKSKPFIAEPKQKVVVDNNYLLELHELPSFDLTCQVKLVLLLFKAGLLAEEKVASIFYALSSKVFEGHDSYVSVLQIIRDLGCVDERRMYNYLSYRTQLPYLDLSTIECDKESIGWLPLEFRQRECVTFFKKSGGIYCMALLNPLNDYLMNNIREALKGKVSFFLTSVEEFENFIGE